MRQRRILDTRDLGIRINDIHQHVAGFDDGGQRVLGTPIPDERPFGGIPDMRDRRLQIVEHAPCQIRQLPLQRLDAPRQSPIDQNAYKQQKSFGKPCPANNPERVVDNLCETVRTQPRIQEITAADHGHAGG